MDRMIHASGRVPLLTAVAIGDGCFDKFRHARPTPALFGEMGVDRPCAEVATGVGVSDKSTGLRIGRWCLEFEIGREVKNRLSGCWTE